MPLRALRPLALLLATVSGLACEGVAKPEVRTTEVSVARVVTGMRSIDGVESFALWRDGEWLAEEYFRGGRGELRDLRSGTKSITSLLIGIALDRGWIESIEQSLGELVPDLVAPYDPEKGAIRLRDLLTMTAGVDWEESDVQGYNDWVTSRDPVGFYLGRRSVAPPGERFVYASAASQMLGEVLARATGMSVPDLARTHLFAPLGIEDVRWERLRSGSYNTSSGVRIRTRDLVTLGRLVLQGGQWDGRQIVSREWIELSTRSWVPAIEEGDYGLHWWIPDPRPAESILALGHGGQALLIVPATETVAAVTCRLRGAVRGSIGRQGSEVLRFLLLNEASRALLFESLEPFG